MRYDQGKGLGDNEQAIVKIKFSPSMFGELIKFEVELSPLPTLDKGSRDVTVNWKMFDNFDPQGQFWTDSNELEMQRRQIDQREWLGKSELLHVLDGLADVPLLVGIHHKEVLVTNLLPYSSGPHDVVFHIWAPDLGITMRRVKRW